MASVWESWLEFYVPNSLRKCTVGINTVDPWTTGIWTVQVQLYRNFFQQWMPLLFSQSYLTPWDPMDGSMPGFPVLHYLPEFVQTHDCWVDDAIQPSHPLLSPSPPALSLSQHQSLFQWVSSSHQVAKVLELQLQHQSFQWIFMVDFL